MIDFTENLSGRKSLKFPHCVMLQKIHKAPQLGFQNKKRFLGFFFAALVKSTSDKGHVFRKKTTRAKLHFGEKRTNHIQLTENDHHLQKTKVSFFDMMTSKSSKNGI